ncbi:MAG: low molecular weight phosphotyrosine protein phosphatase [Bacteroidetes bacterium]|nr:low molecular weight phosphotyrosine protein phosphatase [Bacteroidota bacterium]
MKILFVCLGNICRSPLAEAIFNEKVRQRGLQKEFQSDSCGTGNYHIGDWPDGRAIKCAQKNNILINHLGRQLTRSDLEDFDLILAMDRSNLKNIFALANTETKSKVKLMRSYDPLGTGDVPDPYYGNEKDFDEVFEILDRSVEGLVKSF